MKDADYLEIAEDLRAGASVYDIRRKRGLSEEAAEAAIEYLKNAGIVQEMVDGRILIKCPACGKPQDLGQDTCPVCGVIYRKFVKRESRKAAGSPEAAQAFESQWQAESGLEADRTAPPPQEQPGRTTAPQGRESEQDAKNALVGCGTLIIGGLVIFFVISMLFGGGGTKKDDPTDHYYHALAYRYAQDAVERRLVSPATADFPWSPTSSIYTGDWKYTIKSYVDAQNAFGATVRLRWGAVMKRLGNDSAWSVLTLEFYQ